MTRGEIFGTERLTCSEGTFEESQRLSTTRPGRAHERCSEVISPRWVVRRRMFTVHLLSLHRLERMATRSRFFLVFPPTLANSTQCGGSEEEEEEERRGDKKIYISSGSRDWWKQKTRRRGPEALTQCHQDVATTWPVLKACCNTHTP